MSNTMHTPGPWVCGHRNFDPDKDPSFVRIFSTAHEPRSIQFIAKAYKWESEGEANARLIAAAPDLLAACKAALAALSQPMTYPADIAAAKKWLADADAKAEGRA